jgi:lysophospholipase L1-like esterase
MRSQRRSFLGWAVAPALFVLLPVLAGGGEAAAAEDGVRRDGGVRRVQVTKGMEITAEGAAVVVAPGECRVGRQLVRVTRAVTLPVAPAPIITVQDEALKLSPEAPKWWNQGTRLRGPFTGELTAHGSLVPGSLQIRREKGGTLLQEGEDYLLDQGGAHVGLGPKSRVTADDTVYADYRYSLLRMDTIQVSPKGRVSLKQGEPHISVPVPPPADPGCATLAHVFVPYHAARVAPEDIYPILETPQQAVTRTTPGRIPKTMAKLRAGQPVKIVCWGDSVTAGGTASKPELCYVEVFAAGLRERFPNAPIEVENISIGGSASYQWCYPEKSALPEAWVPICKFQRILDAKPDLVTIEFVNDAYYNEAQVEQHYSDILQRLAPLGAEVILITPHFVRPDWMGLTDLRGQECRPYVKGLHAFAQTHRVALADASARWEHLWKEGLPYMTLLHNTINHPDDRGHRLFAEELWKCFE